jgi:hypothetical protein
MGSKDVHMTLSETERVHDSQSQQVYVLVDVKYLRECALKCINIKKTTTTCVFTRCDHRWTSKDRRPLQ